MKSIEEKIGYHFKDKKLLETALTHSSYAREKNSSEYNERMEFLGDAMLDAIAGEELYRMFPGREEGFLSRTRASLVCEKFLFEVAMQRGIGEHLRLSAGEEKSGGRTRPSILSDAVEALIGAVFLCIVAGLPILISIINNLINPNSTTLAGIAFGGNSLLIVVGVIIELVHDLEAQVALRSYGKSQIKGIFG